MKCGVRVWGGVRDAASAAVAVGCMGGRAPEPPNPIPPRTWEKSRGVLRRVAVAAKAPWRAAHVVGRTHRRWKYTTTQRAHLAALPPLPSAARHLGAFCKSSRQVRVEGLRSEVAERTVRRHLHVPTPTPLFPCGAVRRHRKQVRALRTHDRCLQLVENGVLKLNAARNSHG